jgi:hypothetical protein
MSRALSRNTAEEEARQTGRRLSRNADCLGDGNSGLFGGRKLRIVWGVESGIVFMLASSRTTTQQAISIVPARGIRNCFDAHGTRLMQLVPRVPRGMRGVMRVMPARGGGRRQAGRRRSKGFAGSSREIHAGSRAERRRGGGRRQAGRRRSKGFAGPSRETHADSRAERRGGGGRRQAGRRRSKESRLFWRAELQHGIRRTFSRDSRGLTRGTPRRRRPASSRTTTQQAISIVLFLMGVG